MGDDASDDHELVVRRSVAAGGRSRARMGGQLVPVSTLAEILAAEGYETAAFHEGGYVSPRFGFGRGFNTYQELPRLAAVEGALPDILSWLRGHEDQPYFLFIHTYAAHYPYGGWDQDQAVTNIGRLARFDLDGVETPVGGRDPAEIAVVRREVDVRLIEHVSTPVDALEYIRHESLDVFNIATTGCGGIFQARQIAQMAETAGVGLLLGSTVEMGPGTLAQVQLAASIRGLTLASDLVGPGLYAEDVLTKPPTYVDGCLEVPRTIGFGAGITL